MTDDNEQTTPPPSIKSEYEDGLCPDCGEEIPDNAQYEEACENCGHVWNEPSADQ